VTQKTAPSAVSEGTLHRRGFLKGRLPGKERCPRVEDRKAPVPRPELSKDVHHLFEDKQRGQPSRQGGPVREGCKSCPGDYGLCPKDVMEPSYLDLGQGLGCRVGCCSSCGSVICAAGGQGGDHHLQESPGWFLCTVPSVSQPWLLSILQHGH
jgi:hypothetical protein